MIVKGVTKGVTKGEGKEGWSKEEEVGVGTCALLFLEVIVYN